VIAVFRASQDRRKGGGSDRGDRYRPYRPTLLLLGIDPSYNHETQALAGENPDSAKKLCRACAIRGIEVIIVTLPKPPRSMRRCASKVKAAQMRQKWWVAKSSLYRTARPTGCYPPRQATKLMDQ
jgi:hypothetical protein